MDEAIAFIDTDFNIPKVLEVDWNLLHIDCTKTK